MIGLYMQEASQLYLLSRENKHLQSFDFTTIKDIETSTIEEYVTLCQLKLKEFIDLPYEYKPQADFLFDKVELPKTVISFSTKMGAFAIGVKDTTDMLVILIT